MKRRSAFALLLVAALAVAASAHAQAARQELMDRASSAREVEDLGAYSQALGLMKELRARTPPDADLELAIALNEARAGMLDSAAVRLWSPLLTAALDDTLPLGRRMPYFWDRDRHWLDGNFDGWHWTIARARAEVAGRLGRWPEAVTAAEIAVAARPLSGKEWHVLATCQARAGQVQAATRSALQAAALDPTLPEPAYLAGVMAWRHGHRAEAERAFREAIRRDSTWTQPAVALLRSRLPVAADTIPDALFAGVRRIAALTTPDGPKLEQFRQMEHPALLRRKADPEFPPEAIIESPPRLVLSVLLDARGRPVLHDLPWIPLGVVPEAWISAVIRSLTKLEYSPATVRGEPQPVWVTIEYQQSQP